MNNDKVSAIYFTYFPDTKLLDDSIVSSLKQVDNVVVFNNSPEISLEFIDNERVTVVDVGENVGVKGLNIAAKIAFEKGSDYVVIQDQDSSLPVDYISSAIDYYKINRSVIAPLYYDRERDYYGKSYDIGWLVKKDDVKRNGGYVETHFAIGSGLFVSREVWEKVSGLGEDFFLDCVDMDFCFKLRDIGVPIFIDSNSIMNHSIGNDFIGVLGLKISNHSTYRHQLYYRNTFKLLRRNYVPVGWKFYQLAKVFIQWFVYSIFSNDKFGNFKAFFRAIKESL